MTDGVTNGGAAAGPLHRAPPPGYDVRTLRIRRIRREDRRMPPADDRQPLRTTDLLVLAALTGGPLHGYALAQDVAARSRGSVRVRPGDLYRVLYRMDGAGLIEALPEEARPEGDERRTYYRITPLGRRVAREQARMLADVCAAMLAPRRQGAR